MSPVVIATETSTDRAVRLALAAGTANLRLRRVREVLWGRRDGKSVLPNFGITGSI